MKKIEKQNIYAAVFAALGFYSFNAHAEHLSRLSSNFLNFDGSETSTNIGAAADCSTTPCRPASPDGALFYRKKVHVPSGDNVVYVTFSATADVHSASSLMVSCRINGEFCNPGSQGSSSGPAGWVTLQKIPTDEHDNSIYATWCIPLDDDRMKVMGPYLTVDLKLASGGGGDVYFENAHVYVDSSYAKGKGRCKPLTLTDLQTLPGEVQAKTVIRKH